MSDASVEHRKKIAVEFLRQVIAGRIEDAYHQFVHERGVHHNPFFARGFAALRKGMADNHNKFPHKQLAVKHVVADGDLVVVHSHLMMQPNEPGMIVVHLFRFSDDRIVEFWDCGQPIPENSPNADSPF